ncbi:MAG: type II toxin-antitoxin system RelE/ParE family toxin, partial [Chitinophagaceae bacterium]|nr:type II toxin-antitoxin system RelE/ParE family toxin [Chitinophagaceae bacterium]
MAKYYFTKQAVEDLSAIWNYTLETWSEKQADAYYALLIASCQEVAKKPSLG